MSLRFLSCDDYQRRPACRQSAVLCTLGVRAQFVRLDSFRTDFATPDIIISIVHQPSVLFQLQLEKFRYLEPGGVTPCCRLCQMCANSCKKKMDDSHPWAVEN